MLLGAHTDVFIPLLPGSLQLKHILHVSLQSRLPRELFRIRIDLLVQQLLLRRLFRGRGLLLLDLQFMRFAHINGHQWRGAWSQLTVSSWRPRCMRLCLNVR